MWGSRSFVAGCSWSECGTTQRARYWGPLADCGAQEREGTMPPTSKTQPLPVFWPSSALIGRSWSSTASAVASPALKTTSSWSPYGPNNTARSPFGLGIYPSTSPLSAPQVLCLRLAPPSPHRPIQPFHALPWAPSNPSPTQGVTIGPASPSPSRSGFTSCRYHRFSIPHASSVCALSGPYMYSSI